MLELPAAWFWCGTVPSPEEKEDRIGLWEYEVLLYPPLTPLY